MSEYLESIARLTRDLRNASITLSAREVRFLVDAYYAMQRDRIRADHQKRKLAESGEPNTIMGWLANQRSTLEKQIARALDAYSESHDAGRWARSIFGVGPIISAGLIAHLDIKQAPTVGHFWRIAGLDPSSKWIGKEGARLLVERSMGEAAQMLTDDTAPEIDKFDLAIHLVATRINLRPEALTERLVDKDGKARRTQTALISAVAKLPWNGSLKRLCWLIGESFTKVSNNENDIYGKIYAQRKVLEIARNEAGQFADQAAASLSQKRWKDNETRKYYEAGRLPPARIHLRAQRVAVKLFLSHLHHVMYELEFKEPPPKPFILTRPEHAHYVAPPNWPLAA